MSGKHFVLTIALLVGTLALAEESESPFPFTGRAYTDQYFFTSPQNPRSLAQSSAAIWLEYEKPQNRGVGIKAVGQVDFLYRDLNHPTQASARARLREGFISHQSEGSDLRVGQQIIPWGKSDGINPTDYFTAKDYTLLNPDDEVKRVGAPAVNWSFTPMSGTSPLTFQFVFQAAYPQTRFIIPDTVVPAGIQVNRYPDSPVLFEAKSMEYGLKVAYLKSDFDLSFSLFHGFTSFPEYVFNSLTQTIVAINPAESAVGSDGSFTFKSYIVRWETALHLPENGQANDPLFGLVEPSHWDSVLGIERPLFQDFRIQVQALYRWHLYFRDEPYTSSANPVVNQIQQGVARANATLLNYRRRGNPGATFRLAYAKERAVWTADLFLVGYFATGQDFLLRPQVGFTPRENLKLLAGLDLYGGDVSGPLGALHVQSDAFFEAKLLF